LLAAVLGAEWCLYSQTRARSRAGVSGQQRGSRARAASLQFGQCEAAAHQGTRQAGSEVRAQVRKDSDGWFLFMALDCRGFGLAAS